MAARPVFVPSDADGYLVDEVYVDFRWHPGLAPSQKKKNVVELHAAADRRGLAPLLEISSKSDEKVGKHLSAFNLRVDLDGRELPLENAFQGSKIFTDGGPYQDLYDAEPGDARRDPRVRNSGKIIAFRFGSTTYPSEPTTGFYDWLYLRALHTHASWLRDRTSMYAGYTDIEFNPERSINCQARSFALLKALDNRETLSQVAEDFWALTALFHHGRYWRVLSQSGARML
jgi:hypothetical protein